MIAGFNAVPLIGTPEQVVEKMIAISKAGINGTALHWVDYEAGIDYFNRRVLPLMIQQACAGISVRPCVREVVIDMCLGGGVYRSGIDPRFRRRFHAASGFVTPYVAAGIDESWAESSRSWWGEIANDPHSLWPAVSQRRRLRRVDQEMYELVRWLFEEEIPRLAAAIRAPEVAA